ncbi:hypothetical protein [Streptomyces sp. NPDC057582]|uniref:hypothetical protein n=1 Tax=Streptomyces sp. NPDC057582 TaxID=3346174 RepID=UPI003682A5F3
MSLERVPDSPISPWRGAAERPCSGTAGAAAVGAGLALLAGSARARFGIFATGIASVEDPVHTAGPRRGNLRQNSERKEPR